MTEEQAFLSAISANPDDHTAQLAYADWLQDHDDPRAELMRLRVRVAALQDGWPEARERLTELEKTAPAKWLVQLDGPVWCVAGNIAEPRPSGPGVGTRRFERQFKRNAKVYLAHLHTSKAILASEPMPWHQISVVGPQGKSTGWIQRIVCAWHVTNWRVELVDEPGALVRLKKEGWPGFGLARGAFVCPQDVASLDALRGLLVALGAPALSE